MNMGKNSKTLQLFWIIRKNYYNNLCLETVNINDNPIRELIGNNNNNNNNNKNKQTMGIWNLRTKLRIQNYHLHWRRWKIAKVQETTVLFFWSDIGAIVLKSLNYAYRTGSLTVTQIQGI